MDLPDIIALIRSRLDQVGPYPRHDGLTIDERIEASRTWHTAVDQLAQDLRDSIAARITAKPAQGATVLIAGIRCTSTSGVTFALEAWIRKAERHMAERGAA